MCCSRPAAGLPRPWCHLNPPVRRAYRRNLFQERSACLDCCLQELRIGEPAETTTADAEALACTLRFRKSYGLLCRTMALAAPQQCARAVLAVLRVLPLLDDEAFDGALVGASLPPPLFAHTLRCCTQTCVASRS